MGKDGSNMLDRPGKESKEKPPRGLSLCRFEDGESFWGKGNRNPFPLERVFGYFLRAEKVTLRSKKV